MKLTLPILAAGLMLAGPAAAQGFYVQGQAWRAPPPREGHYTCQAIGCTHWGQRPPMHHPQMHRPPQHRPPMHHPQMHRAPPHRPPVHWRPAPQPHFGFNSSVSASANARASASASSSAGASTSFRFGGPVWWAPHW